MSIEDACHSSLGTRGLHPPRVVGWPEDLPAWSFPRWPGQYCSGRGGLLRSPADEETGWPGPEVVGVPHGAYATPVARIVPTGRRPLDDRLVSTRTMINTLPGKTRSEAPATPQRASDRPRTRAVCLPTAQGAITYRDPHCPRYRVASAVNVAWGVVITTDQGQPASRRDITNSNGHTAGAVRGTRNTRWAKQERRSDDKQAGCLPEQ